MKKSGIIWPLITLTIGILIGFFAGRKTIETKEVVRYIKDDPVSGTVSGLIPAKETVPDDPVFPLLFDTVYMDKFIYVAAKADTAAIIDDYIASREYTPVLFDSPQIGKLSLSATVQYNKLSEVSYEFEPIYREVTKYRAKVWQPYLGASLNTFNQATFAIGTFHKKIALELQYISDLNKGEKGYGVGIKYRF